MNEQIAHLHPELLRRLAHDLRGAVGVVLGALDEVERVLGPDEAGALPFLRMAARGARRSLRIADGLQRTAELESGTVEWARRPVDVRDLLAVAAGAGERREPRKGVRLEVTHAGEPCTVTADPVWLQLALEEVLGNAVRFARSLVTAHVESSGGVVRVTITDDGVGFSSPPQRRSDRPIATSGGVGLSLPMVVQVLAAHGGTLEVGRVAGGECAEPSSGARVTLSIPVLGAAASSGADPEPAPPAGDAGALR